MRAIACLLGVAACSSGYGANVTFTAPHGPAGATSYEIVLASTDLAPVIPDQRVSPVAAMEESVTYYLQRSAIAGGRIDSVDGFRVLVESEASVPEAAFIPFALFYDDAKHLVGIGTYSIAGVPSPIVVPRDSVDEYTLPVEPVTDVADAMPVVAGDVLRVACSSSDTTFVSGIAWRPASGGELRVLFPDSESSLDATARALDLDCDGVAVAAAASNNDCDDTRARFHAGAADVCDGEDTNCDGVQYIVEPCVAATSCAASTGIQVCDDTTQVTRACVVDNACACAANPTSTECRRCVIPAVHATAGVTMCLPSIDTMIGTQGTCSGGCTVQVVNTRGGWTAEVATTQQGPFAAIATGVTSSYALRVTRTDPDAPASSVSVGAVDLVYITAANGPSLVSYDLQAGGALMSACDGTGPYAMNCTP